MLALRLSRGAHLAVQGRRLLVAAASGGTGFLLLCALGHALGHPEASGASALRLAWCAAPLAATVYLAVAVARTDPGTRPRTGLSAIGLGPGRMMAVSATTTALACVLGSLLALLFFLHLRGDLSGMPFDGAAADTLAAGHPLPYPAALTLLALVPATASCAVALALRPREASRPAEAPGTRHHGRFGAYGWGAARETFGAYGRFGARRSGTGASGGATASGAVAARGSTPTVVTAGPEVAHSTVTAGPGQASAVPAGAVSAVTAGAPGTEDAAGPAGAVGTADAPGAPGARAADPAAAGAPALAPAAPRPGAGTLPWGIAVLAAGLAVETYAGRTTGVAPGAVPAAGVLAGWTLTALGLAMAGPGLTHLCGRLLQAVRPGALRLLAGRVLMEEAHRVGRPLGVVCAVGSAAYAAAVLHAGDGPSFGPLSTLGAALVAGCAVATLLIAAVEARHDRAETTEALLRLGAPPATLRAAAAVRAGALLALFGPLTLIVAALAALPLGR
ncbi:hypothetical protein [Streptomyces sp. AD55]|uniref:hypothetical protein n=1 Tax=Streptomyces sp. AD55 TaxID=3242895 RepID=UPI0035294269